jgi:hypothetical protein
VFEQAKTVHALDRLATVIGHNTMQNIRIKNRNWQREKVDQYRKKDNQLDDEITQEFYNK